MTQESLTYTAIMEHVMDCMPGGVLVYRDDEKEEILYANSWLIHAKFVVAHEHSTHWTVGVIRSIKDAILARSL